MELWFKHRCGWHENQKLVNLIVETGYEGYGIYTVLLELLVSQGGSLELNYKKLNHTVRCSTEFLKRVITEFDLFDVVADSDGSVCFYAEWLLEEIRRAKKTSKARSESGKKGQRIRHGVEKASVLANTVGIPENESPSKTGRNQANAQAIASTNASTHARIREDKIDNITDDCCCIRTREKFEKPLNETEAKADVKPLRSLLQEMQGDKTWHDSLVAMLPQVGVKVTVEQMPPLISEFVQFQAARGKDEMTMTLPEAKAWFFNWLMFKIEKVKQNGDSNKPSVATSRSENAVAAPTGFSGGYRKSFAEQVRESKEKLLRDTARMLQNGELGSLGIGRELSRDLQP